MTAVTGVTFTCTHVHSDPKRARWFMEIRRHVPELIEVRDTRRSLWDTTRRGWDVAITAAIVRGHSHVCVLQDDMMPCPNFKARLLGALSARPNDIVCFFTIRDKEVAKAVERGFSWIDTPDAAWGGATVLPTNAASSFLAWERANIRPDYHSADGRLSIWAARTARRVYLTVPSLVQHVGHADSLIGNSNYVRARIAPYVSDGSPVPWDTRAVRGASSMPKDAWERRRKEAA